MDVQDMTDEEYRLHQARQRAARDYRAEGFDDFAEQVERGEQDECQQMRLARFFVEPTPPHSDAYLEAWESKVAALSAV